MKSLVLSKFNLVVFPMIGFFLFAAVFIGVLIWVYRPNSNELYKQIASLPLNKD